MKNIRTAIIGAGYRGRYLITLLQKINLFDIIAVSDISPNLSEIISQLFAGEKIPKIYNSGTDDYRRMLNENTVDLVIIASPWHLHHRGIKIWMPRRNRSERSIGYRRVPRYYP